MSPQTLNFNVSMPLLTYFVILLATFNICDHFAVFNITWMYMRHLTYFRISIPLLTYLILGLFATICTLSFYMTILTYFVIYITFEILFGFSCQFWHFPTNRITVEQRLSLILAFLMQFTRFAYFVKHIYPSQFLKLLHNNII